MKKLNIFTDGGSRGNPGPGASAFVVQDEFGEVIFKSGEFFQQCTNNHAEYMAFLIALQWLSQNPPAVEINFFLDSLLVVNQLNGIFKIKDLNLHKIFLQIQKIIKEGNIKINCISHIPREKNFLADSLVNEILDSKAS